MGGVTRRRLGLGLAGWAGLAVLPAALGGCGGGADRTKARLRLVNATSGFLGPDRDGDGEPDFVGYEKLDLFVDGDRRFAGVVYGASDSYVEVDPDETDSELRRPDAGVALLTFTPSLAEDRDYTVLAYGGEGELATLLLDDNFGEPNEDKTRLRVVNAAPDAGALDVYITGSDEALSGAVPVQAAAAVGSIGSFTTLSSGTRRLRITAAGSKTDLRLDVSDFVLGSEDVSTLVITAGLGGVLVNALRLDQQADIASYDTPQARVRVAAGVAGGTAVSVSLGSLPLLAGGAQVVSDYKLVPAGDLAPTVTAAARPVDVPAQTLKRGGDYTLLVGGPAGAPVARWFVDDNRRPDDAARAKLRLVHGLADLPDSLSLSVDGLPVAAGVSPTQASDYETVPASTTAEVVVRTDGPGEPVFSGTDRVLVAGATYTLFMLGAVGDDSTPFSVVLRQDR